MKRNNFISQPTKRNLLKFLSQSRSNLTDNSIQELSKNPKLRDSKKITLYRGLNFKTYEVEKLFGDKLPNIFTHSKNEPSSWSKSIEIAERFAKYTYLNTESNILTSFAVNMRDGQIDNDLGIILKYTFVPSDILVDLERIPNKFPNDFEYEKEIIIKPGDYEVEIVKVFTKKATYSVKQFNNRKLESNYKNVIKYYKSLSSELLPPVKKLYDEFENKRKFYDIKGFLKYVMKLDVTDDVKKLYSKFIDANLNKPKLDVIDYGGDKSLYHNLNIINNYIDKFDSLDYLGENTLSIHYYRNLLLSEVYNKNIDRMKHENIQKLVDRFEKEMGVSIETVAEKYSYIKSLFYNSVFSMKDLCEEINQL
jgi:hypothetical protein